MLKIFYCVFIFGVTNLFIAISINPDGLLTGIDSNGKYHVGVCALSPGQSITINCTHTGNIKWSKFNITTNKTEYLVSKDNIQINKNHIIISNINFKDFGLYYCEQDMVARRFNLYVFAITQITNGTVPIITTENSINGIIFNQSKLNEREPVMISCYCDNNINKAKLNIVWKGGVYQTMSSLYSIEKSYPATGVNSTLTLKKQVNNREVYGEYICYCNVLTNATVESKVYMQVLPLFMDHVTSIRVNEGEDVLLNCNVWGYPDVDNSSIKWSFQNEFKFRDTIKVLTNSTEKGFSQLFIPKVSSADRGVYTCHATNAIGSNSASTMLRVKGRYAALWPFIGIVVQLVILITIIVIHESNRTKDSKDNNLKCNVESKNEIDAMTSERNNEPESLRQRLVKV